MLKLIVFILSFTEKSFLDKFLKSFAFQEERHLFKNKKFRLLQIVTVMRVPLGILFAFTIQYEVVSLILFSIAYVIDALDGYLAKKWSVQSRIGGQLDHFCDWVLSAIMLGSFYNAGLIAPWVFWTSCLYFMFVFVGYGILRGGKSHSFVFRFILFLSSLAYFALIGIATKILCSRVNDDLIYLAIGVFICLIFLKFDSLWRYVKRLRSLFKE